MQEIYLQKLILQNYRNFEHFELSSSNKPIILIGENGIGKTNILESISLFYPGRGIRGAKFDEICKVGQDNWSIEGIFQSKLGIAQLECKYIQSSNKRITQFNDSKIASGELSKFVNIIWLTPQMENIFLEGASSRRKFLDRITYNFYPEHATKINEYDYYISERSKVLQQDFWDADWLKILEEKIAAVSIIIADYRFATISKMQAAISELVCDFPKAILSVEGEVESQMKVQNAENVISHIRDELYKVRTKDKFSKRASFGVHKSDFSIIHQEKNKLAKFCSTGEQKAMLISIILAQVNAGVKETATKPILLLDEIFVHLDDRRKDYLIDFLKTAKLQSWITATDLRGIEDLELESEVLKIL